MKTGRQNITSICVLISLVMAGCVNSKREAGDTGRPPSPAASAASTPAASTPRPGSLVLVPVPSPTAGRQTAPLAAPGVLKIGASGTELTLSPGGPPAGRLRPGVQVPFSAVSNGLAKVVTPCELTRWIPLASATALPRPQVVLDPGHGGKETGATGPSGLAEKTINLAIASKAAELLGARGIETMITRTDDYRATLGFRTALASAARPDLMISIHHNADPDGKTDRPGSETYYQIGAPASKRLAGLMYEEAIRVLTPLKADWVGDTDAGAKWRPNSSGGDYYGILRLARRAGVTAILAEMAFVSNPSEEALLGKEETRDLEAEAVAQAVTRFLGSKDPGSGFTTPYPRSAPAGPGGGRTGCTDPS
ncbi:MAG: N-acetylmuramoyl-L-alanine amidase family protein [Actinomycetota bacterium]